MSKKIKDALVAEARERIASALGDPNNSHGPSIPPGYVLNRAACMTCGREVNAERVKLGGKHRYCSSRCMDAYDRGWPVYGTVLADYASQTAHRKPVVAPIKAKRKPRKRSLTPNEAAPQTDEACW
jgi:hypothetical protein